MLYVDGAAAQTFTRAITSSFSTSNPITYIGANSSGGRFAGSLAQVCTFDRALTANEVTSLYTTGTILNQAPLVVVGASTNIVMWPANTATVYATVSDDGLPNPPGTLTGSWSKVSGPTGGSAVFGSGSSLTSPVTFSAPGTYVLRYTASDGSLSNFGDVIVNVASNQPPVITSCAVSPTLLDVAPNSSVTLSGYVTDDGLPNPPGALTTTWSQVSGPATVTVAYPSSFNTAASVPAVVGTYVMQFSAFDGAITTSTNVTFVVTNNLAPSVSASAASQAITWNGAPASTTLTAAVSDDGFPLSPGLLSGTWTQLSLSPGHLKLPRGQWHEPRLSFLPLSGHPLRRGPVCLSILRFGWRSHRFGNNLCDRLVARQAAGDARQLPLGLASLGRSDPFRHRCQCERTQCAGEMVGGSAAGWQLGGFWLAGSLDHHGQLQCHGHLLAPTQRHRWRLQQLESSRSPGVRQRRRALGFPEHNHRDRR